MDLVGRVPEELWTEVSNNVQDQNHPKEKESDCFARRQSDCLEEVLQVAEERVAKGKEERERYTQLNAEFQRIAMRDKKAFLSEQCKEIEKNNRMRKTRYLFKEIRDTKGKFYAKIGTIKDRNGKDFTEAEEIKKRWQEYRKELYKKRP